MLPYATLSEAEVAIGRNLTAAETLWFNYTGKMPDLMVYCHTIALLFCVYSLSPLPVVLIELKRLNPFDSHKIQPKVRLSFKEMFRCYKDVMFLFFCIVGPLQFISYPLFIKCRFNFSPTAARLSLSAAILCAYTPPCLHPIVRGFALCPHSIIGASSLSLSLVTGVQLVSHSSAAIRRSQAQPSWSGSRGRSLHPLSFTKRNFFLKFFVCRPLFVSSATLLLSPVVVSVSAVILLLCS
ncbi:hypothetical protein Ahy_A01g002674 isoform C [Arachis hypogaea]|uniref:Uncharacterized protein n=1 Tax=Arachis hypogaea TaxID=3818 RepID=A0A445ER50_ARAHY|nr:hypothetical protein Ahy_A01g002674 isoform C [Arachis hypogaea]